MGKLQSAWGQSPNNAQRLPHDDVLGVFPPDLRFEAIRHPGFGKAFHALRQGALEDHVEGKLVIIRLEDLGFPPPGVPELPRLMVEDLFSMGLSTSPAARVAGGVTGGVAPTVTISEWGPESRRRYSPDAGHAPEVKLQVFDGEGLGQTEHEGALQMGARGLLRAPSKDNIVLIQAVATVSSVTGRDRLMAGHSPDIEVFGVVCATEKAEGHDGGHGCEGSSCLTVTNKTK